jgi:hypothetical protein
MTHGLESTNAKKGLTMSQSKITKIVISVQLSLAREIIFLWKNGE